MTQRICLIDECGKPHNARGWCQSHYGYMQYRNRHHEGKTTRRPDGLNGLVLEIADRYPGATYSTIATALDLNPAYVRATFYRAGKVATAAGGVQPSFVKLITSSISKGASA